MMAKQVRQGDIIKLNLDPTKGHEQAGYRPVLVVSNASYARASALILVCPVTNTDRNNPLHVRLQRGKTTGFVLCEQIRAIDLRARDYSFVEVLDEETLWDVCDIIRGFVDIE